MSNAERIILLVGCGATALATLTVTEFNISIFYISV